MKNELLPIFKSTEIISEHANGTIISSSTLDNKHLGLVLDTIGSELIKLQPRPIVGYEGAERIEVAQNLANQLFQIKFLLENGTIAFNERRIADGEPPLPSAAAFTAVLSRCKSFIAMLEVLVPDAPQPLRVVYDLLTRYGMRTKWEDFEQRRGVIQFVEPMKKGVFGCIMKELLLNGHDLSACIFQDNENRITWSKLLENGRKFQERPIPEYTVEIISAIRTIH